MAKIQGQAALERELESSVKEDRGTRDIVEATKSDEGSGLKPLPAWPDCEYSCGKLTHIWPDSGNKEKIWPLCPVWSSTKS